MEIKTQKKIDVLLDEKRQRRGEIDILVRSIIQFGFLPLALLSGAFIGVISLDIQGLNNNKLLILLVINQALFLLGIVFTLVLINMRVQTRYVISLEKKINDLFGEKVNIWDSSGLLFNYRYSSVPWLSISLLLMLYIGYVLLTQYTYVETENFVILVVNIVQLIAVLISLLIEIFYFERKHINFYKEQMNSYDSE